jgi:hypothetical protein
MAFGFGQLTDLLYECQSLAEVPETETALDPMGIVEELSLG